MTLMNLIRALPTGSRDLSGPHLSAFLRRWNALPNKQRYQLVPELPIPEMQLAAITHSNPWLRRGCLSFLDHYANDESVRTFLGALDDPVPFVREMALHGLSCEQCRTAELCVADVVPVLSRVLATVKSPEVRHKVVPILMNSLSRSSTAHEACDAPLYPTRTFSFGRLQLRLLRVASGTRVGADMICAGRRRRAGEKPSLQQGAVARVSYDLGSRRFARAASIRRKRVAGFFALSIARTYSRLWL